MSKLPNKELIDTEQTIEFSVDETYQVILNWLNDKNAKIQDQQAPNMIKAKHGKRLAWKINIETAQKTMTFLINNHEEGAVVRVLLDTPWHNKTPYEIRTNQRLFFDWLTPLWKLLGTEPEEQLKEDLFGYEGLLNEQLNNSKTMYSSLITLFGGIALFIWNLLNGGESEISTYIVTFGSIGLFYSWNNVQSAKRKIAKLEPEQQTSLENFETQQKDVKQYKNLSILVLVLLIAFGVWAYNQPNVIAYEGNGYRFEYPRYFKAQLLHEEGVPVDRFEYVQCIFEERAIAVYCVTQPDDTSARAMIENLIASYSEFFTSPVSDIEQRTIDDVTIYEVEMEFQIEDIDFTSKWGSLYSTEQDRIYILSYLTDGSSAESLYQDIVDSFETN